MFKKLIVLFLSLDFYLMTVTQAQDIVWISDAYDESTDGIPDHLEWLDFMASCGYTVEYTEPEQLGVGVYRDLDDEKLARLNDADLIIFGRNTNSTDYAMNATQITQWNSIQTPMIVMSAYFTRSNRWKWLNSEGFEGNGGAPIMEAVIPDHRIFAGVTLDANNQIAVLDPNAASGQTTFQTTSNVGNGTLIAKAAGLDWAFVAEWEAGVEFYAGAGQETGDRRMVFMAGTREGDDNINGRGVYNLTDEGAHIFINAVDYMLGKPPRVKAFLPRPVDGQIEVTPEQLFRWRPGALAESHDIYIGTDPNAVAEATRDNPLDVLEAQDHDDVVYNRGLLNYGVTYYWRIDEIGSQDTNSPWKGDVWSFTVLNYPIVLEDFEDYNDYTPNEVWMTWVDGYDNPLNGSSAGYPEPDFLGGQHYLEDDVVHSGGWSMPLFYDNSVGLSEVTRALASPMSDMTREDVVTLTLFYYGDVENAAEPMYVALDNAEVYNGDVNAALVTEWTKWDIPLQAFADQGVNLSNVGSMTIGFGNRAQPGATAGGAGHVFFDDIRLYLPGPEAN